MLFLIIVGLIAMLIIGNKIGWYDGWEFWGAIIITISLTTLILLFVSWIAVYNSGLSVIVAHSSITQTLENFRSVDNDWEAATIAKDIMEHNCEIAILKYWNSTIWGPMIPDAVMELDLIK